MPGRFVVALDQGTTSTKAIVVDESGTVRASASAAFAQIFPQPGWVEHDPEEIWSSAVQALRSALERAGIDARDVAAMGIANQRETIVMWERSSGAPVANAIVWQDRRTTAACEALARDERSAWVRDRTGLRIDPYFSATKIAWLLDHVEGLRERATRGEIACGTVDSWLLWRLTGGRVHATDSTNASRTLLMDLATAAWDLELLALFDVPTQILAPIERSGHLFAETDPLVLGRSVPVAALVGDQQAALLGQGCTQEGQTKNTYGTGSFVLRHTGSRALTSTPSLVATAACSVEGAPLGFALEGSIFTTGAAIQWLRDGLGILDTSAQSEELASSLGDNGDVWFVPALSGLGAPQWDPRARGTIVGVTRGTTRAHMARAALESIAYQTRDVVEAMDALSVRRLDELKVDGGASQNRWLMQFQADVLGVPVVVAPHAEATALGAAYAAGVVTQMWADPSNTSSLHVAERFEPRMSDDQRNGLYRRWKDALERSRDWAH